MKRDREEKNLRRILKQRDTKENRVAKRLLRSENKEAKKQRKLLRRKKTEIPRVLIKSMLVFYMIGLLNNVVGGLHNRFEVYFGEDIEVTDNYTYIVEPIVEKDNTEALNGYVRGINESSMSKLYIDLLNEIEGVDRAIPVTQRNAYKGYSVWGVPNGYYKGKNLLEGRLNSSNDEVVIGLGLAEKLNLLIGETIEIRKKEYKIVGILDRTDTQVDNRVYMDLYESQDIEGDIVKEGGIVSVFLIDVTVSNDELIKELPKGVLLKGIDIFNTSVSDIYNTYSTLVNIVNSFVKIVSVLIIVVLIRIYTKMIYPYIEGLSSYLVSMIIYIGLMLIAFTIRSGGSSIESVLFTIVINLVTFGVIALIDTKRKGIE